MGAGPEEGERRGQMRGRGGARGGGWQRRGGGRGGGGAEERRKSRRVLRGRSRGSKLLSFLSVL